MISDRAKRLIEALQEPFKFEERLEIAQRFLDEEATERLGYCEAATPVTPVTCQPALSTDGDGGEGSIPDATGVSE